MSAIALGNLVEAHLVAPLGFGVGRIVPESDVVYFNFQAPGINVHEHTGDIWIAANNSDRILRYIPGEKRFVSYPMPSRVVWFRDFEFTKDGQVCSSSSNLPAYAHEDGLPAFVCLDPEYKPSSSNSMKTATAALH